MAQVSAVLGADGVHKVLVHGTFAFDPHDRGFVECMDGLRKERGVASVAIADRDFGPMPDLHAARITPVVVKLHACADSKLALHRGFPLDKLPEWDPVFAAAGASAITAEQGVSKV